MKFQVLILTQPSRAAMLEQLTAEFARQQKELGWPPCDVLVGVFDPNLTLGENRNALKARATAEYICFFDDDDWPAADYLARILPLLDGIDYIGFELQMYCQHLQYCEYGHTYHSLKYPDWSRNGMNFYRDITHVNPMRRDLAMQAEFDGNYGEDARWAKVLREKGIVKTEHYIAAPMYHYIWRATKNDEFDYSDPYRLKIMESIRSGATAQPR